MLEFLKMQEKSFKSTKAKSFLVHSFAKVGTQLTVYEVEMKVLQFDCLYFRTNFLPFKLFLWQFLTQVSMFPQIVSQKIDVKAESKVGSLDNVGHKPKGGDKKIFDDKEYLKQIEHPIPISPQPQVKINSIVPL